MRSAQHVYRPNFLKTLSMDKISGLNPVANCKTNKSFVLSPSNSTWLSVFFKIRIKRIEVKTMFFIGNILIPERTVLAPLAGITSLPMRLMAREEGCGLVCTEMISSNGLFYDSQRTWEMLESAPAEKPVSVQIFGSIPDVMAKAASMVEEHGADIIDINFGCSVKKVLKTGSGSELMRDPIKSEAIIKAVRKAIKIPLTIKIRTGWESSGEQAETLAKIAEDSGVDAITVHPRTASQAFGGTADWNVITRIKKLVSIPVIGNGDITSPQKAVDMMRTTGCDAVMIGRAAMAGPQIFSQVNAALGGHPVPEFDIARHFSSMKNFLDAHIQYSGESIGCRLLRSRLAWLVKGLPGSTSFRIAVKKIETRNEALALIEDYEISVMKDIEEKGPRVIFRDEIAMTDDLG